MGSIVLVNHHGQHRQGNKISPRKPFAIGGNNEKKNQAGDYDGNLFEPFHESGKVVPVR